MAGEEIKLDSDQLKKIGAFLKRNKILVVDSSHSCRTSILRVLAELEAQKGSISSCNTFHEALNIIKNDIPSVIISEYTIGHKTGLELIREFKKTIPEERNRLFILQTGSTEESIVAEAVDEDVDGFICKPFTGKTLRRHLLTTIAKKMWPPEYIKVIHTGKQFLKIKEYDQAKDLFSKAKHLDNKPALACYYLGHIACIRENLTEARSSFREGLSINKLHYKCLVSSFEVNQKLDLIEDAYQDVKTLVQYFPLSPERMKNLFRLAVYTSNLADVESYYDTFVHMPNRTTELVRIVTAGLIIAARFLFKKGQAEKAKDLLQKAAMSSGNDLKTLKECTQVLIDFDKFKTASMMLRRFSTTDQLTPDYKILSFLIMKEDADPTRVAAVGLELIRSGIENLDLFRITIDRLLDVGQRDQAEEISFNAIKTYPDQKQLFESLFEEKLEEEKILATTST